VGARRTEGRGDPDDYDDASDVDDLDLDLDLDDYDHRSDGPLMRATRVIALLALTVIVQVVLFPHVRLAGRVPDLGLVLAVAVAFDHGPEEGAIVGFVAGLGFDLFLSTPLGLTALAYALTAYAVGVLQGGVLRAPRWFTPVIGFLGGIAGGMLFVGIGLLAGVDGVHGNRAFVTVVLAACYDGLLAPFVFMLVGALLHDPREQMTGWVRR
jgi:rod shape-determining protein MreD